MIRIANIKRQEVFDLYIGRTNKWLDLEGSKWANPEPLKNESDRIANLLRYEQHIRNSPELWNALHELDGLILGCYCCPKRCHGNVLIELREEQKFLELFNNNFQIL